LNQTLYTAMVEGYDASRLYTLSVYVLATAKQEGFEYFLSPYIKSTSTEILGPHELVEFTQDANKFAKASFITPENAQRYISAVPRKYEWMARALVTLLTELRYTMRVLSETKILIDTGRMQ